MSGKGCTNTLVRNALVDCMAMYNYKLQTRVFVSCHFPVMGASDVDEGTTPFIFG